MQTPTGMVGYFLSRFTRKKIPEKQKKNILKTKKPGA
jgi:hypothetical protein